MKQKSILIFVIAHSVIFALSANNIEDLDSDLISSARAESINIKDYNQDERNALMFYSGQNILNVRADDFAMFYKYRQVSIGTLRGLYSCLLTFYDASSQSFIPSGLDGGYTRHNLKFLQAIFENNPPPSITDLSFTEPLDSKLFKEQLCLPCTLL